MRKIIIVILGFTTLSFILRAQSIPDTELISRIKANRSHFAELDNGKSLKASANELNQDVSRDLTVMGTPGICVGCPKPDSADEPNVKAATNHSDIVVVAHDVKNVSALTQKEAFVFTDSQLIIDEIWKNSARPDAGPDLALGTEITVVEPGGAVQMNGHWIRASLSDRVPLRIGHSYLLYLRYLADSHSYMPVAFGGFDISSLAVVPLRTNEALPALNLFSNKPAFIQALRTSTARAVEESK
jgi:hypothetical protein